MALERNELQTRAHHGQTPTESCCYEQTEQAFRDDHTPIPGDWNMAEHLAKENTIAGGIKAVDHLFLQWGKYPELPGAPGIIMRLLSS